jgi:hypothetical protein
MVALIECVCGDGIGNQCVLVRSHSAFHLKQEERFGGFTFINGNNVDIDETERNEIGTDEIEGSDVGRVKKSKMQLKRLKSKRATSKGNQV